MEAAHVAWNAGSLEGVLDKYVDDLVYISNAEGENGGPLTIYGKEAFRHRFAPVLAAVESKTAIEGFHFQDGLARVRLSTFVRHRTTGHVLTGSFRQLMHFRQLQICKLEDIHDAAKMRAFWQLVQLEMAGSDSSGGNFY